jgi:transcriptional regulator with XRE-family HTH domain
MTIAYSLIYNIIERIAICVKSVKAHILSLSSIKIDNMTELRKILSANMKAYRTELGYSQAKLAELVNTATNYIAQIENGKRFPTDKMLEKIAFALEKRAYELFSVANYEKKIEKDWQTQILNDLAHYIQERINKLTIVG